MPDCTGARWQLCRAQQCGETQLCFSVVRDPWSRVVSCYEKKIRGAYAAHPYRGIPLIASYRGLSWRMPFDAFVEWLCSPKAKMIWRTGTGCLSTDFSLCQDYVWVDEGPEA